MENTNSKNIYGFLIFISMLSTLVTLFMSLCCILTTTESLKKNTGVWILGFVSSFLSLIIFNALKTMTLKVEELEKKLKQLESKN